MICSKNNAVSIRSIQYSIYGPDEIRRIGVIPITETNLYSKGLPLPNAVNDLRLGTIDGRFRCGTCRRDVKSCMCHPAYMDLAVPSK